MFFNVIFVRVNYASPHVASVAVNLPIIIDYDDSDYLGEDTAYRLVS